MKNVKYIIVLLAAVSLAAACDRSDPGGMVDMSQGGGTGLGDNEAANAAVTAINEKYSITVKYVYSEMELAYNWTERLDMKSLPITEPDPEFVKPAMECLDEVLAGFPDNLIARAFPPVILLTSECRYPYDAEYMPPEGSKTEYFDLPGFVTTSVLILGGVNASFVSDAETKEAWAALIVERMMANTRELPPPDDFLDVTGKSTGVFGNYWSGQLSEWNVNFWAPEAFESPNSPQQVTAGNWACGFIGNRIPYNSVDFTGDMPDYSATKNTYGEDLGNYYVFLTMKSQAERDAFYAKVEQVINDEIDDSDADKEELIEDTLDMIRTKTQLAKSYFNTYYGTSIPDSAN